MREIKFRGKRKNNGEWVYGSLKIHNAYNLLDGIHDSELLRTYIEEQDLRWDTEIRCWRHFTYEVIPETVGQFTDFYDKNGKEDWTDDIVKTNIGSFVYYRPIFQAESGAYCINLPSVCATGGEEAMMLITCPHENVGNIYENPLGIY